MKNIRISFFFFFENLQFFCGAFSIYLNRRVFVMTIYNCIDSLFVLRFYGPVNPMGSSWARSVYLTTRLLARLSPLVTSLYSHDITLVLFYWIIKQIIRKKNTLSLETGASLGYTLFSLFLLKNIDCGYSLEPPRQGDSNENPRSMF